MSIWFYQSSKTPETSPFLRSLLSRPTAALPTTATTTITITITFPILPALPRLNGLINLQRPPRHDTHRRDPIRLGFQTELGSSWPRCCILSRDIACELAVEVRGDGVPVQGMPVHRHSGTCFDVSRLVVFVVEGQPVQLFGVVPDASWSCFTDVAAVCQC